MRALLMAVIAATSIACSQSPAAPSTSSSSSASTITTAAFCDTISSSDTRFVGHGLTSVGRSGRLVSLWASTLVDDVAPMAGAWNLQLTGAPDGLTLRIELFRSPRPTATYSASDLAGLQLTPFASTTVTTPLSKTLGGTGAPGPILCWTGLAGDSYLFRLTAISGSGSIDFVVREPR